MQCRYSVVQCSAVALYVVCWCVCVRCASEWCFVQCSGVICCLLVRACVCVWRAGEWCGEQCSAVQWCYICSVLVCVPCIYTCMVPSRPSVVTWSGTFDKCSGAINICSVLVCVPCMCTCMVLSRPSVDTWSGTFDKCSGAIYVVCWCVCHVYVPVWSSAGPVLTLGVGPLISVHWKWSPSRSFLHPQVVPWSKVQFSVWG